MAYKLFYWPVRGRGEQIRLLFHELEQPFEDTKIRPDKGFQELKRDGMLAFGSVPLLQDGPLNLVQGPVIMSYLGRKHDAMPSGLVDSARAEACILGAEDMRMAYFRVFGSDEEALEKQQRFLEDPWRARWLPAWETLLRQNEHAGFLIGNRISAADVACWEALDAVKSFVQGADFNGFPLVENFHRSVADRPNVARYLRERDAENDGG